MKKLLIALILLTSMTSFANCLDLYGRYTLEINDSRGFDSKQVFVSLRSVEAETGAKIYNVYDQISMESQNVLFNYRVYKYNEGDESNETCFVTFNDNWSDFWIFPNSIRSYKEVSGSKLYRVHSFLRSEFGGRDANSKKSFYRFKREISL